MIRIGLLSLFAFVVSVQAAENGAKVIGEVENAISAYDDFARTTDFAPAVAAAKKSIDAIQSYAWPEKGIDLPMRSAITVERFRCRLSWIVEHYKNDFEYNVAGRATELPALNEGLAICHRFKMEIVQRLPLPFAGGGTSTLKANPLRTVSEVGRQPTPVEQERINNIVRHSTTVYIDADERRLFQLNYGYTNEEMRKSIVRVIEIQDRHYDFTDSSYIALRDQIIPGIAAAPEAWRFYDSKWLSMGGIQLECNRFAYLVPGKDGKSAVQAFVNLAMTRDRGSAYFFHGQPMRVQDGLDMAILTSATESQALAQRLQALATVLSRSVDGLPSYIDPQEQKAESIKLAESLIADAKNSQDLIARILARRADFRKIVDEKCVTIGYLATASVEDRDVPLLKDSLFVLENPAAGRVVWCGRHGQRMWMNLKLIDVYQMPIESEPLPPAK